MNGIKIDTLEKFHQYCNTKEEKLDALFELSLDNAKKCQCRLEQCQKGFVKKMKIKDRYLPISKVTFYSCSAFLIFLMGAGIVRPEEIAKWIKTLIPFV